MSLIQVFSDDAETGSGSGSSIDGLLGAYSSGSAAAKEIVQLTATLKGIFINDVVGAGLGLATSLLEIDDELGAAILKVGGLQFAATGKGVYVSGLQDIGTPAVGTVAAPFGAGFYSGELRVKDAGGIAKVGSFEAAAAAYTAVFNGPGGGAFFGKTKRVYWNNSDDALGGTFDGSIGRNALNSIDIQLTNAMVSAAAFLLTAVDNDTSMILTCRIAGVQTAKRVVRDAVTFILSAP